MDVGFRPILSFVIPAYNEAAGIERCIGSISTYAPRSMQREILVVDNGSEDDTATIARRAGATVIHSGAKTIGAVRNHGVQTSTGEVLVFLDADCALTPEWGSELERVLKLMDSDRPCCAGSQVIPPPSEPIYLWKYWFVPFATQQSASHVGSAHMIFRRRDFLDIGGFDETLETGEDFELCARVHAAGGRVLNVPALRVEHYGFPRSWSAFFRRERWHGKGDATSLKTVVTSRVAVASLLFTVFTLAGLVTLVTGPSVVSFFALSGALSVLLAASTLKFRHAGVAAQIGSLPIFPVYFLARTASLVDALRRQSGPDRDPIRE